MPFGYPSGSELKRKIVGLQDNESELMRWLLASGFSRDTIVGFAKALSESPFSSVDRFLEFTLGKYREIGCAAIATEILLRSQDLVNQREYFWMEIIFGVLAPQFEEELRDKKLVVITYNYDCSFEFLLWRGLQSSIDLQRAKATFDSIDVIHLHGQIAPSNDPQQLPSVCTDVIQDSFKNLETGIRSFHEQNPEMDQFIRARKAIQAAKRVCFLGFGYDGVNLEHLLRGSEKPDFTAKFVCGSAFQRTEIENRNVNEEFFGGRLLFGKSDWDASRFLRESGVLEKNCHLPPQEAQNT
jgi:hypothetical protein